MNNPGRTLTAVALAVVILYASLGAKEIQTEGEDSKVTPATQPTLQSTTQPAGLSQPVATPASPNSPESGEEINWFVISSGGSKGSSASYTLLGTLGQTSTVEGSSTNYGLKGGYWQDWGSASCCVARVGDANGMGGDEPTIGDVSVMIDAKFITGSCAPDPEDPIIVCLQEGDINQSGGLDPTCDDITIGDISILIDYLFITGPSLGLADCL